MLTRTNTTTVAAPKVFFLETPPSGLNSHTFATKKSQLSEHFTRVEPTCLLFSKSAVSFLRTSDPSSFNIARSLRGVTPSLINGLRTAYVVIVLFCFAPASFAPFELKPTLRYSRHRDAFLLRLAHLLIPILHRNSPSETKIELTFYWLLQNNLNEPRRGSVDDVARETTRSGSNLDDFDDKVVFCPPARPRTHNFSLFFVLILSTIQSDRRGAFECIFKMLPNWARMPTGCWATGGPCPHISVELRL